MNRNNRLSGVAAAVLAAMVASTAAADHPDPPGQTKATTDLIGYEETPTVNSAGSGDFVAKIQNNGTQIAYTLTYSALSSPVLQAHIHFGRPAISGAIVLFLCTNLAPPAGVPTPPPCPTPSGSVSGTLTAADVIARPAQGIDAGQAGFDEMVKAIRAGAAYANVHTATFPSGEIRGTVSTHGPDDD